MKRIGVVTTSYPRFPGDAAGSFVAEHVAWLRRQGARVDVVAAGDRLSDPAAHGVGGGRLFASGGAPEVLDGGVLAAMPDALHYCLRLSSAVARRAGGWDAAVAHWLIPAAVTAASAPRTPLTAIAHSGDVDLLCRLRLAAPVMALLRARATRLVVVAEHLRERLAGTVMGRLRRWVRAAPVVPMGVELERLGGDGGDERRHRRVLFLGRLVPIKGVETLLEAAGAIAARAELVIAGSGPLEARVRRAAGAGPRFHAPGRVGGEARDALLRSAEVVVIPSLPQRGRTEGQPLVAAEAMAAGAAVVASRTGGLAELPADAVTWVEPGRPRELARAVLELLDDRPRRQRQVSAGRRVVRSRSWDRVGVAVSPELAPSDP